MGVLWVVHVCTHTHTCVYDMFTRVMCASMHACAKALAMQDLEFRACVPRDWSA